jgi:hypothetical protein
MSKLIRQFELSLPIEARHVVFADEGTLAFTSPVADVWKVAAGTAASHPELLFPSRLALAPVAEALGRATVDPARGDYPRLAVSLSANVVVVNTHDLVLVACPLNSEEKARLLAFGWGQYYPRMAFSADHSRFAAKADMLLVYDMTTWRGHALRSVEQCGWHPRQPMHLCVGYKGELFWADWSEGISPIIRELGSIGVHNETHGLVVLHDLERFVAAFHPPRLELWQLNPLRLIEALDTVDGEIFDLRLSPNGKWLVVRTSSGIRLWNPETPFVLSKLFPGFDALEFAPSSQRFVTHQLAASANPSASDDTLNSTTSRSVLSCWEILDEG